MARSLGSLAAVWSAVLVACTLVALLGGNASRSELASGNGVEEDHISRTTRGIARLEQKLGRVVTKRLSKLGQYDVRCPPPPAPPLRIMPLLLSPPPMLRPKLVF